MGYSFAVPSNIAKKVIEDILEYGNVQYGFLGVTGTSLNSFRAKELDVQDTEGFFINGIDKESGANSAGIKIIAVGWSKRSSPPGRSSSHRWPLLIYSQDHPHNIFGSSSR